MKIFNTKIFQQTEGDKILKSILKDIEMSPENYKKLPGGAFLYKGVEQWWGYVQMKPETLTIRKKGAKTKERNLHYDISADVSKKFFEVHESH